MVRVKLLGPVEAEVSGEPLSLGGQRELTVLALLAVNADTTVTIPHLVDAVWQANAPVTAENQVQILVSRLRKRVPAVRISTVPGGYAVARGDIDTDIAEFEAELDRARRAAGTVAAAGHLRAALRLWRGEPFDGLDSPPLRAAARRLAELRLTALEERVELDIAAGRHLDLISELYELVDLHPLRERLHAALMVALHRTGQRAEAVAAYQAVHRLLDRELGVSPGPPLRALLTAILRDDQAAPANPNTLPPTIDDFCAPGDALDRLVAACATGSGPMVVHGPAGSGKTTLAVRLAHLMTDRYPDGLLYLDLHGLGERPVEPAEAFARLLRVLGVDPAVVPDDVESRGNLVQATIGRALVVLDNAAGSAQVRPLLPHLPEAVVVTSRARLLDLPARERVSLGGFDRQTSYALLEHIVGSDRLRADRESADRIVAFCGGVPLALRITGTRLATRPRWTPAQLAERLESSASALDELAHGDLGVRASLSLSYQGLSAPARRLFRRLGLIESDVAPWLATALLDTTVADAAEQLRVLCEVSLISEVGGARYSMHDLVRAFARECAREETDAHRVQVRALSAWLGMAVHANRGIRGGVLPVRVAAPRWMASDAEPSVVASDPVAWYRTERAGLAAAVRLAAGLGQAELCWQLTLLCWYGFALLGFRTELDRMASTAVVAARRAGDHRGTAAVLEATAESWIVRSAFDRAVHCLDTAESLIDHAAEPVLSAYLSRARARAAYGQGRHAEAARHAETARRIAVEADEHVLEAHTLLDLARIRLDSGEPARAREALALAAGGGGGWITELADLGLAEVDLAEGELPAATARFAAHVARARAIGSRRYQARAAVGLGCAYLFSGALDEAERTLTDARRAAEDVGDPALQCRALTALGEVFRARRENDASRQAYRAARELADRRGLGHLVEQAQR